VRRNTLKGGTPPPAEYISKLTEFEYDQVAEETLHSLTELWEEIGDSKIVADDFDVSYSSGVLTVKLGANHGTYVINKQTPNKQIWFSSPISGPKRYDFISGQWVYKYDKLTLHELLSKEASDMLKKAIDFTKCSHGRGSET
jgi:frataxin